MIGQDDEAVGTRNVFSRLDDRGERCVDAIQRLKRLDTLRSGVMGNLVVIGEVRIDDVRAAVHLLDDEGDVHVAEEHVARGAHPRVLEVPVQTWNDARAPRSAVLDALGDELTEEQRERAQVARRAEEEGQERAAVPEAARAVGEGGRRDV